jgi:hypothetical protein
VGGSGNTVYVSVGERSVADEFLSSAAQQNAEDGSSFGDGGYANLEFAVKPTSSAH